MSTPLWKHGLHHLVAFSDSALLGGTVAHELHANHQALAAHVPDDRVLVHQAAQPADQIVADHLGVRTRPSLRILIVASAARR
jgi:hypothetical protein